MKDSTQPVLKSVAPANGKFPLEAMLNDDASFLLSRVKETQPHSKSATLHSSRAIGELLEQILSRLNALERRLQEIEAKLP